MKIAVASDDQVSIAGHFGRCAGFVIYEARDGQVEMIEFRSNGFGHHHQGQHEHHHGHDHGEEPHSHAGFVDALRDCEVVICRGMGRRALADLSAGGIKPAIVTDQVSAKEAAELYAKGNLDWSSDSSCCSH